MRTTPETRPAACHNLLTRDEVAAILRVTPRAVNKFAAQGILPQVRLPGRRNALGYLDSDVHALITACTSAGPGRCRVAAAAPVPDDACGRSQAAQNL